MWVDCTFADLLILLICLPSTLLNNVLTEWQLGSFGCKLSVWLNSTTSCASIFTLVGVTGERYLAICHPLKQLKMKSSHLQFYIVGIWLLSAALASPNLWVYREILYDLLSGSESINLNEGLIARLCVDTSENFWLFIVINLLIAFLVPIIIISFLYFCIFRVISRHTEKRLAVDNGARVRDERVKLRIAQMMFTVIVVFVLCWTPLYGLYCYFFMADNKDSSFFQFASSVLRPIFQALFFIYLCLINKIYSAGPC
uniref:G-protein coupled receptors family 1 profile domain-containing protein n=1 Tax=Meloidogyne incognita TaxID=6306 RepID=A0A914MTM7_MELIC